MHDDHCATFGGKGTETNPPSGCIRKGFSVDLFTLIFSVHNLGQIDQNQADLVTFLEQVSESSSPSEAENKLFDVSQGPNGNRVVTNVSMKLWKFSVLVSCRSVYPNVTQACYEAEYCRSRK